MAEAAPVETLGEAREARFDPDRHSEVVDLAVSHLEHIIEEKKQSDDLESKARLEERIADIKRGEAGVLFVSDMANAALERQKKELFDSSLNLSLDEYEAAYARVNENIEEGKRAIENFKEEYFPK